MNTPAATPSCYCVSRQKRDAQCVLRHISGVRRMVFDIGGRLRGASGSGVGLLHSEEQNAIPVSGVKQGRGRDGVREQGGRGAAAVALGGAAGG